MANLERRKHDIIVELKASCQSLSVNSSKVLGGGPPVLFTKISIEPKLLVASS